MDSTFFIVDFFARMRRFPHDKKFPIILIWNENIYNELYKNEEWDFDGRDDNLKIDKFKHFKYTPGKFLEEFREIEKEIRELESKVYIAVITDEKEEVLGSGLFKNNKYNALILLSDELNPYSTTDYGEYQNLRVKNRNSEDVRKLAERVDDDG